MTGVQTCALPIFSVGASILGAIFGKGLLSSGNIGKVATSARSANSVLKERSDVKLSEQEVAQLNAQIEELMASLDRKSVV